MIKTKVEIKEGKNLFKELNKRLKMGAGSYVSIGVHEDAGKYTDGADAPTVVEVALWNEFGTSKGSYSGKGIPERSFIRSTIDENASQIEKWRIDALGKIIDGSWTMEQGLSSIGFKVQVLIQNKIKSNVPPPNTKLTAELKAEDGVAPNTLIHTGLLLRSITFKVHLGKE